MSRARATSTSLATKTSSLLSSIDSDPNSPTSDSSSGTLPFYAHKSSRKTVFGVSSAIRTSLSSVAPSPGMPFPRFQSLRFLVLNGICNRSEHTQRERTGIVSHERRKTEASSDHNNLLFGYFLSVLRQSITSQVPIILRISSNFSGNMARQWIA